MRENATLVLDKRAGCTKVAGMGWQTRWEMEQMRVLSLCWGRSGEFDEYTEEVVVTQNVDQRMLD